MEKITLQLTRSDYGSLLMMLGVANGAMMRKDGEIPEAFKGVTDWVLIQGGDSRTYTYYHEKEAFRATKEAELRAQ